MSVKALRQELNRISIRKVLGWNAEWEKANGENRVNSTQFLHHSNILIHSHRFFFEVALRVSAHGLSIGIVAVDGSGACQTKTVGRSRSAQPPEHDSADAKTGGLSTASTLNHG